MTLSDALNEAQTSRMKADCMIRIAAELFDQYQPELYEHADKNTKQVLELLAFSLYQTIELVEGIRSHLHDIRQFTQQDG